MKSFQSYGFLVVSAILSVRGSERGAGGRQIWPVEGARATYSRELGKEGRGAGLAAGNSRAGGGAAIMGGTLGAAWTGLEDGQS